MVSKQSALRVPVLSAVFWEKPLPCGLFGEATCEESAKLCELEAGKKRQWRIHASLFLAASKACSRFLNFSFYLLVRLSGQKVTFVSWFHHN